MIDSDLPPDARDSHVAPEGREPAFYGRRKGKALRPGRARLMETLLPGIAVPEGESMLEPRALFAKPVAEAWLEIGFGGGEHLAGQAEAHPDVGIVGCEAFFNGVASLMSLLDKGSSTDRVRIHHGDVRPLMPRFVEASFSRIFVLFPDPWPKTRHAKRRFIGPDNLPELARLLADGGELRVASDDMTYIRWALRHLMDDVRFTWMAEGPDDWMGRPDDWVPTRYEQKAIRQGRAPVILRFRRNPR